MKAKVITSQTVQEAMNTYGEESVKNIFDLIQNKSPRTVMDDLEDENLKKCLLFLLNNDID
jgi:hypothetical protein